MNLRHLIRFSERAFKQIITPVEICRVQASLIQDTPGCLRGYQAAFSVPFSFEAGSLWRGFSSSSAGFAAGEGGAQPNPLSQAPQPLVGGQNAGVTEGDKPRKLGQASALLRNATISPRKLKDACDLVRFQPVEHAMIQCDLSAKKGAKIIKDVIKSAVANATHNHGLDKEKLIVGLIKADKGRHLKRIDIKGRGKTGLMKKYRSHLTVVVREVEDVLAGLPMSKRLVIHQDKGPKIRRRT
mmetsp:Transcript_22456/g.31220  ORF Transcript_22456/g.31220 Transcript_22456/m.31220 type:complete len:241 (+) Transcript_22456:269-991(+)|eukprot:CAMPEP_0196575088 /NCGR_PEP_ID=MMETSP1081-20130531/4654_1 /TAXON_ID=36882 /ORGANISM="Pyramimonas amylifera, Strain CCMP720" /LENGTH=240 /DNA_ID=CAMNT_0041893289 /DNA_START=247 /DNA_END=969 /DNA_ORIENTATION=-